MLILLLPLGSAAFSPSIVATALPRDVRQVRAEALAHGLDVVVVRGSRYEAQQRSDVAPLGRDEAYLVGREAGRQVAALLLDDGAGANDRDHLRHLARLQRDVAEREALVGA